MTKRRYFLVGTAAISAGAFMKCVFAQSAKPLLIGWLHFGTREAYLHQLAAFKEGLAAIGWKEGQQYICEERWGDAQREKIQSLAEELAAKKPALIVAAPSPAVAAAAKAAPATPIVQANGGDPVVTGLVSNLARPGGMITGLSNVVGDVQQKYVEFLLAAAPNVKRIGVLLDSNAASSGRSLDGARRYAAARSIEVQHEGVIDPREIPPAITRLSKQGAQALIVFASPMVGTEALNIIKLAFAHRWPIVGPPGIVSTEAGALISYGVDTRELFRRAAYYVDRIAKGTKPGDLPFEQPTKFELVVNMKTAKALALKMPNSLLVQATRVIE
jgi:putative ABC transport system substrate-binding protein